MRYKEYSAIITDVCDVHDQHTRILSDKYGSRLDKRVLSDQYDFFCMTMQGVILCASRDQDINKRDYFTLLTQYDNLKVVFKNHIETAFGVEIGGV